jgi:hypothetical protein
MASLVKTLCRWYSTVRELMNSRAAISGFGQAGAGQPGDLVLPGGKPGWGIGAALADPLAGGTQLARGTFGEPVGSHGGEHLVGGAQLPTGVGSPVLPAQPFPVQQPGTRGAS